jgi:tetratricopeptide (TPR) repeat protein
MNYGLTFMTVGRFAEARDLFRRAEVFLPAYSTLQVNLAIVEGALGNAALADSHFARALTLAPNDAAAHEFYAHWLIDQGRAGEAIPHLERAIALSLAEPEVRHMLMGVLAAQGSPELVPLARETLRLASTDTLAMRYASGIPVLRPDTLSYRGWFRLGLDLGRRNRHVDAAQAYRAALAIDSTSSQAWNNLGWSLGKLGLFEDAIGPFQQALRFRPGDALASNNLAWVRGETATASFKRAFALQQTGRPAESVPIYRELLARNPRWVNAHLNLAYALKATGQWSEARVEFARTLELEP